MERKVTLYLYSKGIKCSNKGFDRLRRAILLCIDEPELVYKTIKVYKTVAEYTNDKPSRVERAIRHSIEITGNKVKNRDFIANAVEYIRLGTQSGDTNGIAI